MGTCGSRRFAGRGCLAATQGRRVGHKVRRQLAETWALGAAGEDGAGLAMVVELLGIGSGVGGGAERGGAARRPPGRAGRRGLRRREAPAMVPSWWSARVRLARALGSTLIRRRLTCNGWRGCALLPGAHHRRAAQAPRLRRGRARDRPGRPAVVVRSGPGNRRGPADRSTASGSRVRRRQRGCCSPRVGITRDPAHQNFQSCGSAEVAIPPRCRDLPDGGAMLVFAGSFVRSSGVDYAVSQARRDRRRQ